MTHLALLLAVALLDAPQDPSIGRSPPGPALDDLPAGLLPPEPPRDVRKVASRAAEIRHIIVIGGNRRITLESPPAPPVDPAEVWVDGPVNRTVDLQAMMLCRDNFDRLVFQPAGADPADPTGPADDPRTHLHERLEARIRAVEGGRPLDDAEQRQLRLAGTGDIARFLGRVEAARAEFEVDRRRYSTGMAAVRRLELLANQYREGLFAGGSLFAKVLGQILKGRVGS